MTDTGPQNEDQIEFKVHLHSDTTNVKGLTNCMYHWWIPIIANMKNNLKRLYTLVYSLLLHAAECWAVPFCVDGPYLHLSGCFITAVYQIAGWAFDIKFFQKPLQQQELPSFILTGCAEKFAQMLNHERCKKYASTWLSSMKILLKYIVTAGILHFKFHCSGPSVSMFFMFCKLKYQCEFFCTPC